MTLYMTHRDVNERGQCQQSDINTEVSDIEHELVAEVGVCHKTGLLQTCSEFDTP